MSESRPILIIGAPRSGTTLLATMLNAHPNIFLANESKLLIDFLPDAESRQDSVALADALVAEAQARAVTRALSPSETTSEQDSDVAQLLRRLFGTAAFQRGKRRWGEKTAVAYRRLPAIVRAFPDACYIGVERDLVGMSTSYARINPKWGASGALVHWIDFKRSIARQGRDFPILLVDYESLVSTPERTLNEVCRFIGEDFDPAMLRYYETPRARSLQDSPEFAGAGRPLYSRGRARSEANGIPHWLLESTLRYGRSLARHREYVRPPAWEPFLRTFVNLRAAVWEARHGGVPSTLDKIKRSLAS